MKVSSVEQMRAMDRQAGKKLGITLASPPFNGVKNEQILDLLEKAGLPEDGKIQLFASVTVTEYTPAPAINTESPVLGNH